jgi:hypothetical protein
MEISRIQQKNEYLLRNTKTIYRLRKIQDTRKDGKRLCAYVVSLVKSPPLTLEAQVQSFYENCKNMLLEDEILITENRCFKIVAESFEVTYCLEAWRKRADKIAYIENEQVKIEMLHRMGCEQAASLLKKLIRFDPLEVVDSLSCLQKYTNPADRYAALAKFIHLISRMIS